jgi:hypothetical protein
MRILRECLVETKKSLLTFSLHVVSCNQGINRDTRFSMQRTARWLVLYNPWLHQALNMPDAK